MCSRAHLNANRCAMHPYLICRAKNKKNNNKLGFHRNNDGTRHNSNAKIQWYGSASLSFLRVQHTAISAIGKIARIQYEYYVVIRGKCVCDIRICSHCFALLQHASICCILHLCVCIIIGIGMHTHTRQPITQ